MTKKHLPFFLFSLVSSLASGQYEAILKDPDVIWAAEMELTFWIEPEFSAPDSVYSKSNYSTVLKLSNHAIDPADESELLLSNRIFDLLYDDLIPVYARPENQQPLTQRERNTILNIKDTVTKIDPLTGEASISLVYNCWWSGSMQQIRVRQLLFYRDKTDELSWTPLRLRPF